jgi:hypothetical protein
MTAIASPTVHFSTYAARRGIQVVSVHWGPYIALNILYYGLVVLGMIYVGVFNPELQSRLLKLSEQAFTSGPLAA